MVFSEIMPERHSKAQGLETIVNGKEENLFDRRIVKKNIERGLVTQEEYEAFLGQLEDCIDRAAVVQATFNNSDQEEDSDSDSDSDSSSESSSDSD